MADWIINVLIFVARAIYNLGRWLYERARAAGQYRLALQNRYRVVPTHIRVSVRTSPSRPSRKKTFADVYVDMQVVERSEVGGGGSPRDAWDVLSTSRRTVVKGPPGFGKTMLLQRMALAYNPSGTSAGGRWRLPKDKVPVLLRLTSLNDAPDSTLEQLLRKEIGVTGGARLFDRALKNNNLVILLDGLDEVRSDARPRAVRQIRKLMAGGDDANQIIVTCRSSVYREAFFRDVDVLEVELDEFDERLIQRLLHAWPHIPSPLDADRLLAELRQSARMLELAKTPLLLAMMASLYGQRYAGGEEDGEGDQAGPVVGSAFPNSRAAFFNRAVEHLLTSRLDRSSKEPDAYEEPVKWRILETVALAARDEVSQGEGRAVSVPRETVDMALKQVADREVTVTLERAKQLLIEIVNDSGLLATFDRGTSYEFSHQLFLEYFAARALDADGLWERYTEDPETWRESLKLWCGTHGDSTAMLERVMAADPLTALECLAEASTVDEHVVGQIALRMKLATHDHEDPVVRAFGAAASGPGTGAETVREQLAVMLGQRGATKRRVGVVNALAESGLPWAAKLLMDRYDEIREVHAALVRMGTVAVPVLARRAAAGDTAAVGGLGEIGTPAAVETLVGLLWEDESPLVATTAAWHLGALVKDPATRRMLASHMPGEPRPDTPDLGWLADPFEDLDRLSPDESNTLRTIAARIGHLLLEGPTEAIPQPPPALDVRIAVGLWAVEPTPHRRSSYRVWDQIESEPALRTALRELLETHERRLGPDEVLGEPLTDLGETLRVPPLDRPSDGWDTEDPDDEPEDDDEDDDEDEDEDDDWVPLHSQPSYQEQVLALLTTRAVDPEGDQEWYDQLDAAVDQLIRSMSPSEQLRQVVRCLPLAKQVALLQRLDVTDQIDKATWRTRTSKGAWQNKAVGWAERLRLLPVVTGGVGAVALVGLLVAGVVQTARTFFEGGGFTLANVGWLEALVGWTGDRWDDGWRWATTSAFPWLGDRWSTVAGWWTSLDLFGRIGGLLEAIGGWQVPLWILLGMCVLFLLVFLEDISADIGSFVGNLVESTLDRLSDLSFVLLGLAVAGAAVLLAALALTMPSIWLHHATGSWWWVAAFWLVSLVVATAAMFVYIAIDEDLLREWFGESWYSKDDSLPQILDLPTLAPAGQPSA